MKTFYSSTLRVRTITVGILFVAAAALLATSIMPPRLPWAVPTVTVGNDPVGVAIDTAHHTVYVANGGDDTLSVIDSSRCNSRNGSHCVAIATITAGPNPLYVILDPTTDTIYASILGDNTIAVINGTTCNATNTSGCGQIPATVSLTDTPIGLALDATTHTLYFGYGDEAAVGFIDTATCNATNTSGCGQIPVQTSAGGDTLAIDYTNHGVYVSDFADNVVHVFNGATCNAGNTSGCGQSPATVVANFNPLQAAVDAGTHTVYVPVGTGADTLGSVLMIDGSNCNGSDNSGCGNTPNRANVGSLPGWVLVDPATETVYVENPGSSSLSVINGATCNAINTAGCVNIFPALASGINGYFVSLDPNTHTLYETSQDTNRVWVLDAHKCDATHTQGCTDFAPRTIVGAEPIGGTLSAQTRTLYVSNQEDGTVSIINTTVCNQHQLSGCNQSWPTINLGGSTRFEEINEATHTLYVANFNDGSTPGWVSVINSATCNSQNTSNCSELAQIPVGLYPDQMAIDPVTDTIYLENRLSNSISIINGLHCNASDVSACNQAWPAVAVGARPQGLGFNPARHTLYVANTGDDTVSVISTAHCAGGDTSGCVPLATVPVGAAPRAVAIVNATNSVFVGNRDDLTVSVFDGSTCNGSNTSGCPQAPPPAFAVGAFPDTGGNGQNLNGRGIVFSSRKHTLYIPVGGDSSVAEVDTNACRAGHVHECHVRIEQDRAGGFPLTGALDETSDTVYVVNDADGTVSLFRR